MWIGIHCAVSADLYRIASSFGVRPQYKEEDKSKPGPLAFKSRYS